MLLTKCGALQRKSDGREDGSAGSISADLEGSLTGSVARSSTCCSFMVRSRRSIEPGWEAVCEQIALGRARAGGMSNYPVALMDRASAIGPVSVVQHQYSLLHRTPEVDAVLSWCADNGAAFLAWSPLASGFLADGSTWSR